MVEEKKDEAKEKEVKPADKEVTEKAKKDNSDKGSSLKQNISEETMAQFSNTSKEVG